MQERGRVDCGTVSSLSLQIKLGQRPSGESGMSGRFWTQLHSFARAKLHTLPLASLDLEREGGVGGVGRWWMECVTSSLNPFPFPDQNIIL